MHVVAEYPKRTKSPILCIQHVLQSLVHLGSSLELTAKAQSELIHDREAEIDRLYSAASDAGLEEMLSPQQFREG